MRLKAYGGKTHGMERGCWPERYLRWRTPLDLMSCASVGHLKMKTAGSILHSAAGLSMGHPMSRPLPRQPTCTTLRGRPLTISPLDQPRRRKDLSKAHTEPIASGCSGASWTCRSPCTAFDMAYSASSDWVMIGVF